LQERLEGAFGLQRLVTVAVRFLHALVMRHADLHLRVRGFIEEREEGDEILVFGDGLRQPEIPPSL